MPRECPAYTYTRPYRSREDNPKLHLVEPYMTARVLCGQLIEEELHSLSLWTFQEEHRCQICARAAESVWGPDWERPRRANPGRRLAKAQHG